MLRAFDVQHQHAGDRGLRSLVYHKHHCRETLAFRVRELEWALVSPTGRPAHLRLRGFDALRDAVLGCRHRTRMSDSFALSREPVVQPALEIWFCFRVRNPCEGNQALSAKTVQ